MDDEHIKLAQRLLKDEYPNLDSFQSTLLSQNDGLKEMLYNINMNHWVTSSSFGNEVVIYDRR